MNCSNPDCTNVIKTKLIIDLGFGLSYTEESQGYEEYISKYTKGDFIACFIDGDFICCGVHDKNKTTATRYIKTIEEIHATVKEWYDEMC